MVLFNLVVLMRRCPVQFGLSTMMWLVAFAAFNFWLCSLGAGGVIVAVVIDKHVLVAYLCMKTEVDRQVPRAAAADESATEQAVHAPAA